MTMNPGFPVATGLATPALLVAAPLLTAAVLAVPAHAAQPPLEAWKERRELMLRLSQQQQLRLQQQVLCLQKAGSMADLESCRTVVMPGWMHGAGMGGWGCPMW